MRRIGIVQGDDELLAALVDPRGAGGRVRSWTRVPLGGGRGLEDALREAAEHLGAAGRRWPVSIVPAPGDVWVKLLTLPPLPTRDRERLLETEAERYFPVRGEPVLVDVPEVGPVAAARSASVEALVARVEELVGPVRAVVPAPQALVRGWTSADPGLREQVFAVVARDASWWEITIARDARLVGHARLFRPAPEDVVDALTSALQAGHAAPRIVLVADGAADAADLPALTGLLQQRLPEAEMSLRAELATGTPAALAAAVGAALCAPGGLLPASHRRRLRRVGLRRTAAWAAAAMAAAAVLLASDPWARRSTALERSAEVESLLPRADSAQRLLEQARRARQLAEFTDSIASSRPSWPEVLAELSRRLPEGAYLTRLQASGDDGTLELHGYAGNASTIVPMLERSEMFQEVESTEAVARRTVGGVELENFALRLKAAP